jgi:AcrR family transcriptional regulator
MGRREQAKHERRQRILDAAEAMIRRDEEVAFSMRQLAKEAGVSFVTPFNLLGSKLGVLVALVERSVESRFAALAEMKDEDPIERIFALGDGSVRIYAEDEAFARPLIRALMSAPEQAASKSHFLEGATALWGQALSDGAAQRLLRPDGNVHLIARQLHVQFRGGLALWATGEIDGNAWLLQFRYGVALVLLAAVKASVRTRLRDRLGEIQNELARHLGHADRLRDSAA